MNMTDPIRRVSGEHGQVQIRPDHVASGWRPTFWWVLASRRWTGPRPINAYVIEHRNGCPGGMPDRAVLLPVRRPPASAV
jgi:hypothetical protein